MTAAEGGDAVFERFTDRARRVLVLAQEEARLLNHSFIGTEHILLGLIHEDDGLVAKALEALDISLEAVRDQVEQVVTPSASEPTGSPPFTPRAKKVLELSLREALQLGHDDIGPEHMLLGLVREGEGVAAQVLIGLGADLPRVRQEVIQLLSGYPSRPGLGTVSHGEPGAEPETSSAGLSVEVAGRSLQDYSDAINWLDTVLTERGIDIAAIDPGRIRLRGVNTPSGPGLRITCWPQ